MIFVLRLMAFDTNFNLIFGFLFGYLFLLINMTEMHIAQCTPLQLLVPLSSDVIYIKTLTLKDLFIETSNECVRFRTTM